MADRDLDPDNDYQYDRTNRPPLNRKSRIVQATEARARQCQRFQPHATLHEFCITCNGPKYAHSAEVLTNQGRQS